VPISVRNVIMNLDALDIKAFTTNAVHEVFKTMLSMEVVPAGDGSPDGFDGTRVVGSVSFAGKVLGNISIHMNEAFARVMTAVMLGMEEEEVQGEEDVNDVIGEMSNMIGGNLKSRLCDAGLRCDLSIPNITCGTSFHIECRNWARHERLDFHYGPHAVAVEVCIKEA